jgi:hypothetical protein
MRHYKRAVLEHRSIKTTQHYAKILDKKVSDDMKIPGQNFLLIIILKRIREQGLSKRKRTRI